MTNESQPPEEKKAASVTELKQPDAEPILRYFRYDHLPTALQEVSRQFMTLALYIVDNLPRNPERTVALRKLLEGKDAAVRARLTP